MLHFFEQLGLVLNGKWALKSRLIRLLRDAQTTVIAKL